VTSPTPRLRPHADRHVRLSTASVCRRTVAPGVAPIQFTIGNPQAHYQGRCAQRRRGADSRCSTTSAIYQVFCTTASRGSTKWLLRSYGTTTRVARRAGGQPPLPASISTHDSTTASPGATRSDITNATGHDNVVPNGVLTPGNYEARFSATAYDSTTNESVGRVLPEPTTGPASSPTVAAPLHLEEPLIYSGDRLLHLDLSKSGYDASDII
jgi:hypothetical protein